MVIAHGSGPPLHALINAADNAHSALAPTLFPWTLMVLASVPRSK